MEIRGIQRTKDVENIQTALNSISPIKRQIEEILQANETVDKDNEMTVTFLNSAKESLSQTITELSCAISDIVGIDVMKYYSEENK